MRVYYVGGLTFFFHVINTYRACACGGGGRHGYEATLVSTNTHGCTLPIACLVMEHIVVPHIFCDSEL